jgi:hypothetical protein
VLAQPGQQVAQRVPGRTNRRRLGQRNRLAAPAGQQQLIGPVHVDAGQQHQVRVGQVRQHRVSVGTRHRPRVDHRVRPENPQLNGHAGQGVPRGVHMRAAGQFGRLGLAPVHDHHVVAPGQQLQRDPPADEQGAAEDQDPHTASGRCRTQLARR